jgi:hypothetical protein
MKQPGAFSTTMKTACNSGGIELFRSSSDDTQLVRLRDAGLERTVHNQHQHDTRILIHRQDNPKLHRPHL